MMSLIVMIFLFLLTLAALWNLLLDNEVQYKGWIVFFLILLLGNGIAMFLILYKITDQGKFDLYVQFILDHEKELLTDQHESEKDVIETKDSLDMNEVKESVKKILAGINSKSKEELSGQLLRKLSKKLEFVQGIMYVKEKKSRKFSPTGTFALTGNKPEPFTVGKNIAGQAAENKTMIRINDIPENYFDTSSGLGNAKPKHLLFIPIVYKNQSIGLIEAGFFKKPDEKTEEILNYISVEAGELLYKFLKN